MGKMAGIRQVSQNVIVRQAGIIGKDVIFRLAGGEQVEDELNSQPGPRTTGFPASRSGSTTMRSARICLDNTPVEDRSRSSKG
jgi:hypothetical protein